MKIHKEGRKTILLTLVIWLIVNSVVYTYFSSYLIISGLLISLTTIIAIIIVCFFRIPNRILIEDDNLILAPCDGEVVVIEEVEADEFFNDKRLQVSVFMSVFNVHVNRNPIEGKVIYSKYHKGKNLVAWHPKSSTKNERHSVVYQHENGKLVLAKQIAGALANRIVNYLKVGEVARQNKEMGFIKFGSRVDLLLPLDTIIEAKLGDKVKSGISVIGRFK
ncbi:phosphatidylserine decarboxylase family protein [Myroides injenensis]|uniref:phosphatidylserine decarboxylase family protein n=1 Tax=Myroides injenensis TaxID=1183151 RepID=UPI000289A225|nr:phosphatidylserine decarboxylase family protein [Myroides injenensis]